MFEHFQETGFRICYEIQPHIVLHVDVVELQKQTKQTNKLLLVKFCQQDFSIISDVLPSTSLNIINFIFSEAILSSQHIDPSTISNLETYLDAGRE